MFTIRIEITDDVGDVHSRDVAVEHGLGELREEAIQNGKDALRAALALVWGDSVHEEFGDRE